MVSSAYHERSPSSSWCSQMRRLVLIRSVGNAILNHSNLFILPVVGYIMNEAPTLISSRHHHNTQGPASTNIRQIVSELWHELVVYQIV